MWVVVISPFASTVKLCRADKPDEEVDGKSILGVLLLAACIGTQITIRVDGEDQQDAIDCLRNLVADGFGELDENPPSSMLGDGQIAATD